MLKSIVEEKKNKKLPELSIEPELEFPFVAQALLTTRLRVNRCKVPQQFVCMSIAPSSWFNWHSHAQSLRIQNK